jgi:p-aminobenzoyl-glutamate transporter AbgT
MHYAQTAHILNTPMVHLPFLPVLLTRRYHSKVTFGSLMEVVLTFKAEEMLG